MSTDLTPNSVTLRSSRLRGRQSLSFLRRTSPSSASLMLSCLPYAHASSMLLKSSKNLPFSLVYPDVVALPVYFPSSTVSSSVVGSTTSMGSSGSVLALLQAAEKQSTAVIAPSTVRDRAFIIFFLTEPVRIDFLHSYRIKNPLQTFVCQRTHITKLLDFLSI